MKIFNNGGMNFAGSSKIKDSLSFCYNDLNKNK